MTEKRWAKYPISREIVSKPEWEAFFKEYTALCEKYNLSLGHEDSHGAFILGPLHEYEGWAENAHVSALLVKK